jgi:tRNA(fMet)-specific endonuclease VapC
MKYLLDTDVIVNQLRGKSRIKESIFEKGAGISIITFGELLYGAERSANKEKSLAIINEFITDLDIEILGLSQEIMKIYAKIKCSLEKKGKRLDEFDLLIGSTALQHSMTIVTRNLEHFKRIPDLKIEA